MGPHRENVNIRRACRNIVVVRVELACGKYYIYFWFCCLWGFFLLGVRVSTEVQASAVDIGVRCVFLSFSGPEEEEDAIL